MYCQHCGVQLPDNAKFCTECGSPTGGRTQPVHEEMGTLKVSRKSATMASAIATRVYVDGELHGAVGNGGTESFLLPPGSHSIELKTPGNSGIVRSVIISPNVVTVLKFKLSIASAGFHDVIEISDSAPQAEKEGSRNLVDTVARQASKPPRRMCPRCGGPMAMQTVSESRKSGCGTIILYILLALTIFGLLIVIPLALRRKTETVTYAVCQSCGYRALISRSK